MKNSIYDHGRSLLSPDTQCTALLLQSLIIQDLYQPNRKLYPTGLYTRLIPDLYQPNRKLYLTGAGFILIPTTSSFLYILSFGNLG